MRELLPEPVLSEIARQYRAAALDAASDFDDQFADEDRITGALAAILKRRVAGSVHVAGQEYHWATRLPAIRGRGPGAPENEIGADAVLEIQVKDRNGWVVGAKVLPIQAKKVWDGRDANVEKQARKMLDRFESGLIVDYRPNGYRAVDAAAAIEAGGNVRRVQQTDLVSLGDMLADRFLACTIGTSGLRFDERDLLLVPVDGGRVVRPAEARRLIRTTVEMPGRPRARRRRQQPEREGESVQGRLSPPRGRRPDRSPPVGRSGPDRGSVAPEANVEPQMTPAGASGTEDIARRKAEGAASSVPDRDGAELQGVAIGEPAVGSSDIAARPPSPGARQVTTSFHAKYWANSLLLAHPRDAVEALSRSIGNARVDLNPHQVDAALFALRSPYSKGVLLADEVGLGKTIEASLILAQKWAERRRRILLIVPATLRKQWQVELEDKFFLPSTILEARAANALIKKGIANPFVVEDCIVICSYQFVYAKRDLVQWVDWDLVVIDEAHRLRSIYKGTKTAEGIVEAIRPARKLLLTATPLQNSLLELYGLVGILDPEIFGSQDAFQAQFLAANDPDQRDVALRERIQHVCKRTLRRQVLEYVPFTNRFTHTADFVPSAAEEQLYDEVSAYLQRDVIVALPNARRKLITLIMRKLLASSPAAIGASLAKFVDRLSSPAQPSTPVEDSLAEDFETLNEIDEEWGEDETPAVSSDAHQQAKAELADLKRFVALAQSVERDSKAKKLVEVLPRAFELAQEKGAARKAVIFTESCRTQEYLFRLLSETYPGEIVLMNGSNNDETSKRTYAEWKRRNEHRWEGVSSGSKSADMKAAIVDEFRERGTLLLATESAAEGVNLQFCSIVVNYDLPWNPQRIEQRIGRCHRYGQKSDVLVVNFLNRKNDADRRVFELLDQKFNLFKGVFGASDDVLGVVESGVDLEKRIAAIYQDCRTPEQIKAAFDTLQLELDDKIKAGIDTARRAFLENFDAEVHERLRVHKEAAKQSLDTQQQMLLDLAKFALVDRATFDSSEPRFQMRPQGDASEQRFHLDWQRAEALGDAFFRVDHPLAHEIIQNAATAVTSPAVVTFFYESHASALDRYRGATGWLEVSKLTAEAVGRSEEFLIVAACDAAGQHVAPDVAAKFFSLRGDVGGALEEAAPPVLAEIQDELKRFRLADLETRNEEFFQEEVDKLDRWAEDVKFTLERELKDLDAEIRAARKSSKSAVVLAEKLEAQRLIKHLEQRRTAKRRQLFDAQDDVDKKRSELIEEIERQLKTKAQCETVFTIRWVLADTIRT